MYINATIKTLRRKVTERKYDINLRQNLDVDNRVFQDNYPNK